MYASQQQPFDIYICAGTVAEKIKNFLKFTLTTDNLHTNTSEGNMYWTSCKQTAYFMNSRDELL